MNIYNKYQIPNFDKINNNNNYIFYLIKTYQIQKLNYYLSIFPSDINVLDKDNNTPLFYAIYINNFEIVQLCIKYKANINHHNKYNISPLLLSFYNDNNNIIKILLQNNANIDEIINTKPIFFYTIIYNNFNAFLEILNTNINIDQQDTLNQSALFYTINAFNNYNNILNNDNYMYAYILIQNNIDINIKDIFNKTVLCYAILKNNYNLIKLFIENNADINIYYNDIDTPLFYAIKNNNIELVKLLIKYNVDLNKKNKNNELPIIYVITHNQINILKLLLNSNCIIPNNIIIDINNNKFNMPLIIYTIKYCNSIISVLLIENNIKINYIDKYDNNLLYYAILYDKPKIVSKLYEEQLNINHINNKGESLTKYIHNTQNGYYILYILLNNNINLNIIKSYFLTRYIINYNLNFILLIAEKIKYNFNDKKYKYNKYTDLTILHLVSINKHNEVLMYFLKDNIKDINNNDNKYKLSPLFFSMLSNNIKNIELLILNGADINKLDINNNNIIQFALKNNVNKKIIKYISNKYKI